MHWLIDYHSGVPVYLQVVQQVRAAVASGVLRQGDQLPSVRALAEQLKVNRNTISRAFGELEGEGLLENRQGSGAFVTASVTPLKKGVRSERIAQAIDLVLVQAHQLQVPVATVRSIFEDRVELFLHRSRGSGTEDR